MTNIVNLGSSPYIFATLTSAATSVTGDGTVYTAVWNNVVTGTGYNTSTGVFTCQVSGEYLFSPVIYVTGLTASHTLGIATLVATLGSFQAAEFRIGAGRTAANTITFTPFMVPVKMAVGDTARIDFLVSGSTKVINFDTLSTLTIARLPS